MAKEYLDELVIDGLDETMLQMRMLTMWRIPPCCWSTLSSMVQVLCGTLMR